MKHNINILLVGLGSEIGSTLISLVNKEKKNIKIKAILTNKISLTDKKKNFESLRARLVLNEPNLLGYIKYDLEKSLLIISQNKIKVFWGDFKKFNLKKIDFKFDAAIVATSTTHINNKTLMRKLLKISRYVFGVAEAENLPSVYPNLLDVNSSLIENKAKNIFNIKEKVFALGSCQTNGWLAQLRAIIEVFKKLKISNAKIIGCELDIIHPDTPQGRLGTKSIEARDQDARNNLRPGFSQVDKSMRKLFLKSYKLNTISLRTLTVPPGYQISRFYIKFHNSYLKKFTKENFKKNIEETSKNNKFIYSFSDNSLGSRAFEKIETAAVILTDDKYLHLTDNFLELKCKEKNHTISRVILQSYVHNTRGYCRSVIETIKEIVKMSNLKNKKINCW